MIKSFHLSFVVPNLEKAKDFYIGILGCSLGRDTGSWIDIIFFGHQITIHQENEFVSAKAIDHFGPILDKADWEKISKQCVSNNVNFIMPPTIRDAGTNDESGKFLIKDPAGNLLEFKYYTSFATTVGGI